jgi:tetratricopeptide (TPR) repeat protein
MVDIALRKGDVNEARDLLEQAGLTARSVVDKAQVHAVAASLEFRLGRIRAGIEQMYLQEEFLVQFLPPFAVAQSVKIPIVRALNSLGDPDGAQEVLDLAFDMVPPPLDQFFAFSEADILIERGEYDQAEAATQRAAEMLDKFKLEDLKFLVEMIDGFIQRERGDYAASSAGLRAARERINSSVLGGSELYRELPFLSAELAHSLVLGGNLDEAEKALAEGFRLDPSEPLLWLNKARFQLATGLPQLAQASVSYALAIWKDADPDYRAFNEALSLEQEIKQSLSE